jgi:predicted MFS family arabinose efflux permease
MLGVALAPLLGGTVYDHLRHRPLVMWGIIAALSGVVVVGYARFGALRGRRTATSGRPDP